MAVQDPDQQPQPTNPTVQRLIKAAAAGEAAKAAAGAAVAPGVAVTLPARAAVAAISVPVEAFAHGVKIAVILSVLRRLLKRTHADSADWLTKQLRKQFPDADPSVIRQAVERELKFEEAFQQKALVRVEADLHKAGALTTPEARQKRVNGILAREKHYAELREKAMLNRAKGFVQNAGVKAISPNGAKWVLGNRKNHTLGCLALAGKNWPWEVLDTIAPPLHSNCGCELKPLGPTDTVPPVGDAMAMAKAALALEEAIRVVAAPGEVDLYLAGRALLEASGESLQEINWSEWLHPRGRGGKWMDKLEPEPHKPEHEPKPKEPDLPKVPKPDPHMPKLSPESTVVSGPKPEGEKILGGDVPEPAHQGPIPSFDHIPLKLQLPPAFGADHIKAKGGDQTYFVKDYGGDRSQVASELLANAVYRELGVDVPTMGHVKTAPEPDFAQRTEDLPNEPPIDAEPNARISTGIILREPDGRMTLIEPRNHYGGYIHTFPKGGVESNLTPQQNAHKELWEETGLHAHITGVVGDFKGDTGTSRFYLGVRTGGDPTPSDETQAIKTVTPDEAAQMLNKQRDQDILKALLEQPIPEGTFEDAFPPEAQGSALAVPGVDGKTKEITAPNEALGRGYMADALLGNRNFLGQRGENIRWPNENTPVRTNMGSTLGYGARGKHEFGSTPEEVWTMRTRGQAAGTVPQGEDELRQQASDIAKILTDAKIDELTKAAPFPDPKERKQIAKTLKARVAWMRRFADGSESLPTPASGAEARAQFADAQDGFEIYPEERQAMEEYAGDAGRTLDGRLTSGKNFTDADRKLAKRLDSVLEASRAPVDSHVYVGAPGEPKAGMVGKAFSMKPYIRAHTEMTNAKGQMRMRLLVPGDARALHLEDAPKGEPDMLLPRGQRIQVTGMRTGPDGVPQLDGIVLPYQNPPRIPSDWKPSGVMGQTTIAGLGPKVPKGEIFKKGDRVDVNGNKATVTGDAGKGMANVKLDSGKGYTVPFKILKRLEESAAGRQCVLEVGRDLSEAFDPLQPRGRGGKWIFKGKLFTNQEAGKHMADRVLGWRAHEGRTPEADTPSPERIAANWTKQLRGRLSKDREAIGAVAQASRVNEASPRWQALTHNRPADLVLVTKEPTKGKFSSLVDTQHAAHRVGATTIIPEANVKAEVAEGGITGNKKPSEHPSATSAYGLAGVLRHEYGHSVDDALPRDQRRHILDAIPDPGKDLGYYAGIRDNEMIPELIATITHPDYDPKDFPETVQEAERRLWKALGIDPEAVAKAVREHNLEGDWKGNEAAMADAQRALRAVTDRYDVPTKNVRIDKDMTEDVGRFAGKSKNTIYVSPHIVDEEYMAKRKKEFAGTMVEVPNDPTGRVRTITHEYGHILDGELLSNHKDAYAKLDAFLNEQGSYGMPGTRTRLQAGLEAPSAYGTTNRYEFVAEALTDWIHNGDKAHPSSQAIGKIFDQYLGRKALQEAGSVADFREWLHPRGRGGKWIEGTRREAPAAATAIKAIASPSAPPIKESLARIKALGISVVPPGKKSKFSPKEIADIADVFEEAFKQYPVLDHGPGAPIRRVEFTSGGHGKLKPGVLADTGIRPASTKQAGWNIPTGSNITVLRFNDSYGYGLKPAGPPPPNAATGGSLAPSNSSWAGIAWHELGHAMMNAIDMAGHHDSKRYVDWMARYGVSFEDCKNVSTYAVASRSEGIAELCSMENTPGYSGLLDPELEGKAHQMFEDLRNWDVGTPYAYQKPLIANPKPTPKIKAKAPTTPKPPSKTTPTYAMPPPSQLAEIEAAVKASPGTAGVKMPVAEMDLNPGDVFEGSTPGLRYLVIADPSEKNGLRYVPLNQGKANAYRFSSTSKRRKVDLHFELQEGQMTIDTSPETLRKIDAAAARNLEAGDWVAPDPLLDQNDPPTPAVQESIYTEGLHPRGRGGKWIGKGIRARPAPKERTLTSVPEPAPAAREESSKSPVDTIIESLGGKKGDEGYQALASGAATDTQKIYQVDGKYTEDRQALHQKIIDHFFADAKPAEGKAKAIFTAGGAASGKSALAGQSKPENNLDIPEGAVYINPDDIKEMLPEYNALKKQGREDVAAAATHEESSDLAKLMTALAMDGNYPVIVDGTGDSKVGKFGGKLKAAADAGYDVEARYAHVPVDEAIKREAIRAERTGRKVATTLLREQHKTVAQSYKDVMENQPGVHVKVYSTIERGKPKLIAESPPGAPVHVLHKQHYADHLAKADA